MNGLKNKDLTEFDKELEKLIKEDRINKIKGVAKMVGLFVFGFILSYFIGNTFFSDFIKETGFWGYLFVYVGLAFAVLTLEVFIEIIRTFLA